MRPRSILCAVLNALLLTTAGCSDQPAEQEPPRTTIFDPRVRAQGESKPPLLVNSRAREQGPRPELIVLEDKRCTERSCDTAAVIARLQTALPGLKITRHDWSSGECEQLLQREGLKHLPAYLLHDAVTAHPGFGKIAKFVHRTPKGRLRHLRVGASFDPRAEICDNGVDDTGDGLVDCKDPGCEGKVVCRPTVPRRLELFIMAQCPHGIKALNAMSEVLAAFGRRIDFRIHYIADATKDGFKSLHGQPEVEEDLRELCAMRHYGAGRRHMDYIWCRNRDMKADWRSCAKESGINQKVIERCSGAQGRLLLREDIELAKQLGISNSPTWLVNNRFKFHGIAAKKITRELCRHNPALAGCDVKTSTSGIQQP